MPVSEKLKWAEMGEHLQTIQKKANNPGEGPGQVSGRHSLQEGSRMPGDLGSGIQVTGVTTHIHLTDKGRKGMPESPVKVPTLSVVTG